MRKQTDCQRCGADEWYKIDIGRNAGPAERNASRLGLCSACPEYTGAQRAEKSRPNQKYPPWLEYDPIQNKLVTRRTA